MKELFRKFQLIASLALGSAPVAVLVFAFLEPSLLSLAWLYPVAYGVFCILCAWIAPKVRLVYGIVVSVGSLILSVLSADGFARLPLLITAVCYGILFLWSLTVFGWPPNRELPDLFRLACILLHVITQFVIFMDEAEPQSLLTEQALGLRAAFLAYLVLLLLSMNRSSIHKASFQTRRVPDGMRRKNTLMTVVLAVLAGLASFIPYVYDWVKAALVWLVRTLMRPLTSKPSEPEGAPVVPPEGMVGESTPMTDPEQGPLGEILEMILLILGIMIMIGVLMLFAVVFVRKLMKWMKNVWFKLEQYASAVAEDYEDEITDIRKESLAEGIKRQRRTGLWKKEPVLADPGENIRYRYRWLLRKHPKWTASTTARENMPRKLAELYEKARYSDHPVTESEADVFIAGTKELR